MKDIEEILKILGICMTRPTNTRFVWINQSHYIQQILVKFGMKNAKPASTLMDSSIKLDNKISKILSQNNYELYQRIVRKIIFTVIVTWINIIFAMN